MWMEVEAEVERRGYRGKKVEVDVSSKERVRTKSIRVLYIAATSDA